MALVYTSRDAYNGCLSLFSDEEALHRGFSKMRISGDVSKTANGYEFKISRISAAHKLPILVNDDYEKNGLDPEACSDYTIPNTAYAKIILTTDASLFPSQQQRFRVTLQFSNFDFTDLAAWPPLNPGLGRLFATSSDGECSVSLGESWSLCDMHSEIGSDASGDWELVCMEAVGQELRLKNCQAVVNNPHNPPQSLFSYADAVKKDAPHSTGREIGHYESPKRKYSEQKWQPVFQIRHVSVMDRPGLLPQYAKERLYDYCGFEDECDDAYESFKSFGSDARSNMLIANIAFGKKKDLGIIAAGSRTKSVK